MSLHNVWILNHYAHTPELPGGTRHYELARRLAKLGFDVTVIASAFHHSTRTITSTDGHPFVVKEIDGVRFVWIRSNARYAENDATRTRNMIEFALRSWWKGRQRFEKLVPTPDAVLGSSPHLLTPLAAWRLARRFRVPFLFEVRDLWPETIVEMGVLSRRNLVTRLLYFLERFLYARTCKIISLLPDIAEYLERIGRGAKSVTVIPNGVDVEAFACPPAAIGTGVVRLVYAGAHGPANGLEHVLEAANLLTGDTCIEFHFYGSGPRKPDLIKQAQRAKLRNVYFHDAVPKLLMPNILCGADILLLNYAKIGIGRYGISPNKLWEYMASGRPILFAHEATNDPVAETGCGISVPPEDPITLANAIRVLVAMNPAERTSLGAKGSCFVRENRDWGILVAQYAHVLRSALNYSSKADENG